MTIAPSLTRTTLSIVIGTLLSATAFDASAFDVPGHVRISNEVTRSVRADIAGRSSKFSPYAVTQIANANEGVDYELSGSAAIFKPERHFTNEQYSAASQRLISLRKHLIIAAKSEPRSGDLARKYLGQALHTLQDFYSHSNWIDRGNSSINSLLGVGVSPNPTVSSAPCPAGPNTLGPSGGGTLTSYYFVGWTVIRDDFGCDADDMPANKCFHGNYTNACPGLNKDLDAKGAQGEGVTPHPLHGTAAALAKQASKVFVQGILDELKGDDKALTTLLDVRGTLGFVIDNTGSMGSSIAGVSQTVNQMVAEAAADPDQAPENYLLVVYGDPFVGSPLITENVSTFQSAVASIWPNGGGDCPELSQSGLIRAIDAAAPDSRVFLFTDATSKDAGAVNQVIARAQAKGTTLVYGLTGSCSPTDPAYIRGAAETGGQVFRVSPAEIPKLYDFIRPQLKGKMATIARRRIDLGASGSNTMQVPVDSTMTGLLVAVSVAENNVPSHQTVQLIRPSGLPVATTDPGVKIVSLSFGLIAYVEAPEAGEWQVKTAGYGPFTATAQGNSSVNFSRFDFVEPNGDIHGGFPRLAGQPVVGEPGLGQASLIGPLASAEFKLIDEAGNSLGAAHLTDEVHGANPEYYLGEIPLPSVPFRIEASGVDSDGVKYQRQYPAVFRAQSVAVRATGLPVVTLAPAVSQEISFTVENFGLAGTFYNAAVDPRGYVLSVSPASIVLGNREKATVTVKLMAPVSALEGDDSEITFTATRAGSTSVFNSATTLATVAVNRAPVCPSQISETLLWPPNGQFTSIDVAVQAGVSDPDNDSFTVAVTSITQDEPVAGRGHGNKSPDASGLGLAAVALRAERLGGGNGRMYAINYEATDSKGAACTGILNVGVPHDRTSSTVVDDGQNFSSTVP